MDDERLLSEALRAHAAGGVSTPRPVPPSATPATAPTKAPTDTTAARPRRRSANFLTGSANHSHDSVG